MAWTKTISDSIAVDGVHTLTLDDVLHLYVGDFIRVSGVGATFDGDHVITAIDTDEKTVSYEYGSFNHSAAEVSGQLIALVHWINEEDLETWLGIDAATSNDTAFMQYAVETANEWAFTKRREAGYKLDRTQFTPDPKVKLGTIMFAAMQYRSRGAIDSYAGFDQFSPGAPSMTLGQIYAMLGTGRPQVA